MTEHSQSEGQREELLGLIDGITNELGDWGVPENWDGEPRRVPPQPRLGGRCGCAFCFQRPFRWGRFDNRCIGCIIDGARSATRVRKGWISWPNALGHYAPDKEYVSDRSAFVRVRGS